MIEEKESFDINATHGFQKVEGLHALERIQVILEEEIYSGDKVMVFSLSDGKHLLTKDPQGIEIDRITSTYIMFKTDIIIKEI